MQTVAAHKIRVWLARPGNTQEKLARLLREQTGEKTNQSTISAWAADRQKPRGVMMAALQAVLRIALRDWVTPYVEETTAPRTGTEG